MITGVGKYGASAQGVSIGFFDYNDAATTITPITVLASAGDVILTNDELGAFTNKTYKPTNVTDVWDASIDEFDWSELALGDIVDIRLDVDVITTSVNTEIHIDLNLGTSSYKIPFVAGLNFKAAATHKVNVYNGIYMGDDNTRLGPATFTINTDKDCTVVVNGWYCKIVKR